MGDARPYARRTHHLGPGHGHPAPTAAGGSHPAFRARWASEANAAASMPRDYRDLSCRRPGCGSPCRARAAATTMLPWRASSTLSSSSWSIVLGPKPATMPAGRCSPTSKPTTIDNVLTRPSDTSPPNRPSYTCVKPCPPNQGKISFDFSHGCVCYRIPYQWLWRGTSEPLPPTRKSRSAPRSACITVSTYRR